MRASVHLLTSLILAGLLYPVFKWKVVLILVGGFLIDVDHYILYIYRFRKFNFIECNHYFTTEAEKNNHSDVMGVCLAFHTIEFFLIVILLAFYYKVLWILVIGLVSHYLWDLYYIIIVVRQYVVDYSFLHWLYKHKQKF